MFIPILAADWNVNFSDNFPVFICVFFSDGWANRKELTDGLEEYAAGSITIKPHNIEYEQFNEHYFSLDPLNNTFNPWFRDFWEQKFSCRLEGSDDNEVTSEILQPCIGK